MAVELSRTSLYMEVTASKLSSIASLMTTVSLNPPPAIPCPAIILGDGFPQHAKIQPFIIGGSRLDRRRSLVNGAGDNRRGPAAPQGRRCRTQELGQDRRRMAHERAQP